MLHVSPEDPRLLGIMNKAVDHFRRAIELFDTPVHTLEIPYEEHKLPGYLYLPGSRAGIVGDKVPVLINTNGFDSIQEELYFFTASGAVARGYAALTFDGPGQGIVLRRDKLSIRPDWEVVISAVLDELYRLAAQHPEWNLDLSRVALTGAAMGGYFAMRGATDPRIKAGICTDSFYDMGEAVRDRTPFFMKYLTDDMACRVLNLASKFNIQHRFEFGHSQLAFGANTVTEGLRRLSALTLEPDGEKPICSRITCPILVTCARDTIYNLESQRIYDALTKLKDGETKVMWDPVSPGQGSLQAKVAAMTHYHAKVFSWLDHVFKVERLPLR
jgi:dienelactone hydrolase